MSADISDVLSGCLGFFTPALHRDDLGGASKPGRLSEPDGSIQIETLENESVSLFGSESTSKMPEWMLGQTQYESVIATDITKRNASFNIGGGKALVQRHFAQSLVYGTDVERLNSSRFNEISVHFPDVAGWAGISALNEEREIGADQQLTGIKIHAKAAPVQSINLTTSRCLDMSTHWEVSGPESRKAIYAPLEITFEAKQKMQASEQPRPGPPHPSPRPAVTWHTT